MCLEAGWDYRRAVGNSGLSYCVLSVKTVQIVCRHHGDAGLPTRSACFSCRGEAGNSQNDTHKWANLLGVGAPSQTDILTICVLFAGVMHPFQKFNVFINPRHIPVNILLVRFVFENLYI